MSYNDSEAQLLILRACLIKEIELTSGMRVALRVNKYLEKKKKTKYSDRELQSYDRRLRVFSNGGAWKSVKEKSILWETFVSEGKFSDRDLTPDTCDNFCSTADRYFKQAIPDLADVTALIGRFFVYKRAIRDPEASVVRFLLTIFQPSSGDSRVMQFAEIHRAGLFNGKTSENWDGCLVPRKTSYLFIAREAVQGTPRTYIMRVLSRNVDKIIEMSGRSLETMDNWGEQPFLESPVYTERVPDDMNEDSIQNSLNLYSRTELFNINSIAAGIIF